MDYQQQDSQEFLRFLLDGMSEDLCRKASQQQANDSTNIAHRSTSAASKSSSASVSSSGSGSSKTSQGNGSSSLAAKSGGTILPMLPQHTTSAETSPNSQASGQVNGNATKNNDHTDLSPQKSGNLSQKLRSETRAMREQQVQQAHSLPQQGGVKVMGAALTRMSSRGVESFATPSAAFAGADGSLREEEEDSDDSGAVIQVHTHPTAKARLLADIKLSRKLNSHMDSMKGSMSQLQVVNLILRALW